MKSRKFRIAGGTFLLYRLVNKVNDKAYIGITSRSLHIRRIEHMSDAMSGKSHQPIHRAIRKYGAHSFTMELLETADSWDALCQREIAEIAVHKRERTLYNASWGGEGTLGIDRSYATGENNWRRRTAEGRVHLRGDKNHMRRPEHRERMRRFNPATRPGVMDCIKGDLNPAKRPEVRAKISANCALNDPARRDEVRARMSASMKGKPKLLARGGGNHKARAVRVHSVVYGCMLDAAQAFGFQKGSSIKKRIEAGTPGFYWANEPEVESAPAIQYKANKKGQYSFL